MAAVAGVASRPVQQRASKESVAKQFVKLYYNILNTNHTYLHQFYGSDSSIVVSEMLEGGKTMTETATDIEALRTLLISLYDEVNVSVDSSVPQFTTEGSILLLVTGTMTRKSIGEDRIFTQALLLMPQENGYFIRTDTVHVLGKSRTIPVLDSFNARAQDGPKVLSSASPDSNDMSLCGQRLMLDPSGGMMITDSVPHEGDPAFDDASFMGQGSSSDIQTSTPPAQEAEHHLVHRAKYSDSDEDHSGQTQYSAMGLPPVHGGSRPPMQKRLSMPPNMPIAMPPMSVPGHYARIPHHAGHRRDMSMGMNMPMGMPAMHTTGRPSRRRSLSMGSDPRPVTAPPGHGVFIARLPFGIQPNDVLEAFSTFGPVLGEADGIQVRDGRNGCYAFVTFELAASANTAIQKGAVVQGKRVYVEPRYPRQEADPPHAGQAVNAGSTSTTSSPPARSGIPCAPKNSA